MIQHVREKFACRTCAATTQPPAPVHAIARGIAGLSAGERLAARAERSRPLVDDLALWLHHKRTGNWTFAGSDTGGHRAAALYTLIENLQNERRRSPRLAGRRAGPPAGAFRQADRRTVAVELEG